MTRHSSKPNKLRNINPVRDLLRFYLLCSIQDTQFCCSLVFYSNNRIALQRLQTFVLLFFFVLFTTHKSAVYCSFRLCSTVTTGSPSNACRPTTPLSFFCSIHDTQFCCSFVFYSNNRIALQRLQTCYAFIFFCFIHETNSAVYCSFRSCSTVTTGSPSNACRPTTLLSFLFYSRHTSLLFTVHFVLQ